LGSDFLEADNVGQDGPYLCNELRKPGVITVDIDRHQRKRMRRFRGQS